MSSRSIFQGIDDDRQRKRVLCGAGRRTPVHQRLGSIVLPTSCWRISDSNVDGWCETLLRAQIPGGGAGIPHASTPRGGWGVRDQPPKPQILEEWHNKCFNCLSMSHRVSTYRLPWCRGFQHLACDCMWSHTASRSPGGLLCGCPSVVRHHSLRSPSSVVMASTVLLVRVQRWARGGTEPCNTAATHRQSL